MARKKNRALACDACGRQTSALRDAGDGTRACVLCPDARESVRPRAGLAGPCYVFTRQAAKRLEHLDPILVTWDRYLELTGP